MRLTRFKLVASGYGVLTLLSRSRKRKPDDLVFLNWGYEDDPPMNIPLDASDEPDRYGIQLYHRTATQVDLTGKQVLEVGCGHGGGASYLMRTLHPATYTGLDLNGAAIKLCLGRHNVPGLTFMKGDAENLPFPDESFDAVINVESSHCYPHLSRFFAEVARVLRPGGHFLYSDMRQAPDIPDWQAAIADAPMRLLSERVINAEVLRGLEKNSPQQTKMVERNIPPIPIARWWARSVFGVEGGAFYRSLQAGKISYKMFCFVKP
ncbi:phthiotriol/phenolphthiotriol dimycocerosates methyltransferase [Mycobacterium decipiens]|uniref:SAM-dependent methyltransferase n=1 Tax=Mycobacterium decipiens TaxID=1430326 RepID=A0A1X2LYW4_9MYCO|nr:SAM-dependent methyltransferase [Mycobacterium decipiens]